MLTNSAVKQYNNGKEIPNDEYKHRANPNRVLFKLTRRQNVKWPAQFKQFVHTIAQDNRETAGNIICGRDSRVILKGRMSGLCKTKNMVQFVQEKDRCGTIVTNL